jgi:DNA-binding NtrC family response regulator
MAKKKNINIFIVDDDLDAVIGILRNKVGQKGFEFSGTKDFTCKSVLEGIAKQKSCTILFLDIQDSISGDDEAGIRLFHNLCNNEAWKEKKGSVQIVFFSNANTVKNLYKAVKSEDKKDGAELFYLSGYLGKKALFSCNDEAIGVLLKADNQAKYYKKNPILADPIINECELLHHPNNESMKKLIEKAYLAGKCHETVLILGETGTGKELLAKFIFYVTENADEKNGSGGFLPLNIGAQPTSGNLQYTELFGAKMGAFNDCPKDRKGVFEKATCIGNKKGATVFLDEIGDAHETIQTALLRVIQEGEIIPLGGFDTEDNEEVKKEVVFRLITATNVDIQEKIKSKVFRLDLYHRISTIEMRIPPLRVRKIDIPVLAYHFVEKMNEEYNKDNSPGKDKYFTEEELKQFEKMLKNYDWPGNVRELEKIIRHLYVMSPGMKLEIKNIRNVLEKMISISATECNRTPEEIFNDLHKTPLSFNKVKSLYGDYKTFEICKLIIEKYKGIRSKTKRMTEELFKNANVTNIAKWYDEARKGFDTK